MSTDSLPSVTHAYAHTPNPVHDSSNASRTGGTSPYKSLGGAVVGGVSPGGVMPSTAVMAAVDAAVDDAVIEAVMAAVDAAVDETVSEALERGSSANGRAAIGHGRAGGHVTFASDSGGGSTSSPIRASDFAGAAELLERRGGGGGGSSGGGGGGGGSGGGRVSVGTEPDSPMPPTSPSMMQVPLVVILGRSLTPHPILTP